jgi:UDP-glucose 4-epimerase
LDVEDRVIAKFMSSAIQGNILQVNGASEALDFTYVDDVAQGIVLSALSDNTNNKTYNLTKSYSRSLLDAANLVVKIAGNGSVKVNDKDSSFPSRGSLNIDAARRDFGYFPQVDIEEGFQAYYEWLNNSVYRSKKTV